MPRKIYLASSWRNGFQPYVVRALREEGHEVYDFRNPSPEDRGFHWTQIDQNYVSWDSAKYIEILETHSRAQEGFRNDKGAMEWSDTGVLLLPAGNSACLEAGWLSHPPRELHILIMESEIRPDLMYKMAKKIHLTLDSLLECLTSTL